MAKKKRGPVTTEPTEDPATAPTQQAETVNLQTPDPFPYIAEGLRPLAIPIEQLNLDPANARKHPVRNLATVKGSLHKHGQVKNIVVQREGMIVRCGNGTVEAAKALGWTHVAALILDKDDVEATLLAIADNRSSELAEWDLPVLGTLLESFDMGTRDLVGFSADDMDNVMKQIQPFTPQVNPSAATGQVTDGDVADAAEQLDGQFESKSAKLEVCCPGCGKVFQVDSPTGKDAKAGPNPGDTANPGDEPEAEAGDGGEA